MDIGRFPAFLALIFSSISHIAKYLLML